jgi:hypothetical protein
MEEDEVDVLLPVAEADEVNVPLPVAEADVEEASSGTA